MRYKSNRKSCFCVCLVDRNFLGYRNTIFSKWHELLFKTGLLKVHKKNFEKILELIKFKQTSRSFGAQYSVLATENCIKKIKIDEHWSVLTYMRVYVLHIII